MFIAKMASRGMDNENPGIVRSVRQTFLIFFDVLAAVLVARAFWERCHFRSSKKKLKNPAEPLFNSNPPTRRKPAAKLMTGLGVTKMQGPEMQQPKVPIGRMQP